MGYITTTIFYMTQFKYLTLTKLAMKEAVTKTGTTDKH